MELAALIAALRDPNLYPHRPHTVDIVQTHASVVALAGDAVYKLKKPVSLGFLDYSTLARRRRMCRLEVELNRRLAPNVYLGVVRLTDDSGRLRLDGAGTVVDYLVHMRRLDDEAMLARRVQHDSVTGGEIGAIARKIAAFHAGAATGPAINRFGSTRLISRNVEENFAQTAGFLGTALPKATYDEIAAHQRGFLREQRALLQQRIDDGRIRDCHGDLRCDHVYLTPDLPIIDCIEFNTRFRYGDTAADVAFLTMDLAIHGAPDLAAEFVDAYRAAANDDLAGVLDFYQSYRAFVRGKVALIRAGEPELGDDERADATREAAQYFGFSRRYARGDHRPRLILVGGLTGTGKTTLARAVSRLLAARVISADVVRKQLAGIALTSRHRGPVESGIYTPEMNTKTYAAMLDEADALLRRGRSVILDATYRRSADRVLARRLAELHGARFFAVECRTAEDVIKQRLEGRLRDEQRVSDGTWDVYLAQRTVFEPFSDLPADEHAVIDTGQPTSDAAAEVFALAG